MVRMPEELDDLMFEAYENAVREYVQTLPKGIRKFRVAERKKAEVRYAAIVRVASAYYKSIDEGGR